MGNLDNACTKPLKITEVKVSSIIIKSKLPDTDYVINPYGGCSFGCKYCYASFMCRFLKEDIENWGKFIQIKTNAIELADKEIPRLQKLNSPSILFGSVTDAWQGIESKYKLTRGILEQFVKHDYNGIVSCLTKSNLITRDIDVLKRLKNVKVGLTITSTDDNISRFLETNAPSVSTRISTLKRLNDENIKTYAFVGPIFPHFIKFPEQLDEIFKKIKKLEPVMFMLSY